jgi:hypothetical protein
MEALRFQVRTIRYRWDMPPVGSASGSASSLGGVLSRREARVILGTAVAGIIGAIFAIPTAAAILSVTDYLRQRDVLLRAEDAEPEPGTSPGQAVETPVDEVAASPTA